MCLRKLLDSYLDLFFFSRHPRNYAFNLKPHSMSQELIEQLKACSVALGEQAELLQQKIKAKANKNKDYADLVTKAHLLFVLFSW